MSESVSPQPEPKPEHRSPDAEVFAQVEKWMEIIREISSERVGSPRS